MNNMVAVFRIILQPSYMSNFFFLINAKTEASVLQIRTDKQVIRLH